jgi:hypothetical protein
VFEQLVAHAAARARVSNLIVQAIRAANDVAPSSWATTLFEDLIRLNVGPAEMMTIGLDELRLVLHRECDWKVIRRYTKD